ncbi:MAG: hypothetical protein QNL62_11315 [Gammaproteobacteria bacterium]|nr:hypothetical protein [Gammaproteobacteria bacterium]
MRIYTLLRTSMLFTLMIFSGSGYADGIPEVPKDYPSHKALGKCYTTQQIELIREQLNKYNVTRLEVSEVLRKLADKYKLTGETRNRLLGFAGSFELMKKELPSPDPDSDDFRNFDFKLGLAFTSLTVFLNSNEDTAQSFYDDRDNKGSELGIYLAELDTSRDVYMSSLQTASNSSNCVKRNK